MPSTLRAAIDRAKHTWRSRASGSPGISGSSARLPMSAVISIGLVGRAQRPVVGCVGGPGPATVRVVLLVRVEPVVAPICGWLAAQGARWDLRGPGRDAVAVGAPDPH